MPGNSCAGAGTGFARDRWKNCVPVAELFDNTALFLIAGFQRILGCESQEFRSVVAQPEDGGAVDQNKITKVLL